MPAASQQPLLDAGLVRRLEGLELQSRKILAGKMKGEKRSKRRGQSVEFADYRPYVPGDDLRFVDWNIYMRLGRLFLKLFLEEEDLCLYILLDCSGSMDYGSPAKFDFARRLVAALGYVGLVGQNRVGVGAFADGLQRVFRPARGRQNVHRLVAFLEELEPGGVTNMGSACRRFVLEHPRRGVAVLVSDFLDKRGYEPAIRYFLARSLDVQLIHILAPEEINPPLAGDLRLVDQEDGDLRDVTISAPLLRSYQKNLQGFIATLQKHCRRHGMGYSRVVSDSPLDEVVLRQLRLQGLVR